MSASEIFGDQFEFFYLRTLIAGQRASDVFQAVVDVVVDQRFLGLRHGLFDRLQLLRHIKARPASLQHLDDGFQVTIRSFEAVGDVGVRCVRC